MGTVWELLEVIDRRGQLHHAVLSVTLRTLMMMVPTAVETSARRAAGISFSSGLSGSDEVKCGSNRYPRLREQLNWVLVMISEKHGAEKGRLPSTVSFYSILSAC